jgi:hypothetical protein
MGLAKWANTRDGNEQEVVDALLAIGASVFRMDKPCDLLVGYRGINFLLEVKLPLGPRGGVSHSKPNQWQEDFFRGWSGQVEVVRSGLEAVELVTAPRLPIFHGSGNFLH